MHPIESIPAVCRLGQQLLPDSVKWHSFNHTLLQVENFPGSDQGGFAQRSDSGQFQREVQDCPSTGIRNLFQGTLLSTIGLLGQFLSR